MLEILSRVRLPIAPIEPEEVARRADLLQMLALIPTIFRGAGNYLYTVPVTGQYTMIAAGPGGGGAALNLGPYETPQRFWGGGAGGISRAVRTLTAGMRIPVSIARPGPPMIFRMFGGSAGLTIIHGVSGTGFLPWAPGGKAGMSGAEPQNDWDGNNGWADLVMNGTAGGSGGTPGVTMSGQSFAGDVNLTSGYGGDRAGPGGDGSVLFAYLGPPP